MARCAWWAAWVATGWSALATAADPWKSIAAAAVPALLSDEIQLLVPARDGSLIVDRTSAGLGDGEQLLSSLRKKGLVSGDDRLPLFEGRLD